MLQSAKDTVLGAKDSAAENLQGAADRTGEMAASARDTIAGKTEEAKQATQETADRSVRVIDRVR